MEEKLQINPWFKIWTAPRKTIRSIIAYDKNHRFIVLSALYGFQYLLGAAQFLSIGTHSSLLFILLLSAVLAIPIGYFLFNLMSLFLFYLGKLIKGEGGFKEIRAAMAWSSVPHIFTIFIWLVLCFSYGQSLFVIGYEKELVGVGVLINLGAILLHLIFGIWELVIFVLALGEVQKFSVWMALLNSLLAWLGIGLCLFFVIWGVSAIAAIP
ncbi:MAG: YIP1 family protein [Simkania negevensis]|nr:YIP1 family protein [Simkania negevensis]